jgi:hypothetical protein
MLVLVSMATDEMICLVSMYPDVWFMDTTAGKFFSAYIYEVVVSMNSYTILSMNSYKCGILNFFQEQISRKKNCLLQAERGFAAWAVFVGRTVVFVRGKGKGA